MIILKEVKIKYDHLDHILKEKVQDIRFSNNINVIIDLKEIFRKLFRPNVIEDSDIVPARVEELSSDIINIISHYRNYFYKAGKYTSFYFLYSKSECALMKARFADYKKEYYETVLNNKEEPKKVNLVKKTIEVIDKVINNVPNSMFIDTSNFDEFVVAKFLVQQTNPNELNFILSNDEVMVQLIDNHTFVIDMKSNSSKLLDTKNAVQVFSKTKTEITSNLSGLYAALTGTRRYNLFSIPKFAEKKSIHLIEKLIKKDKLVDRSYIDFPLKLESLDSTDSLEKILIDNFVSIKNNYDIVTGNSVLYAKTDEMKIMFNKPVSMHSWNYFLDLNAKVFTRYPLSLDMLLRGETVK
jgi:hypothetical protein